MRWSYVLGLETEERGERRLRFWRRWSGKIPREGVSDKEQV